MLEIYVLSPSSAQKITTVYGLSHIYSLSRLEFCFRLSFFSFYSSFPSYVHLHFCIIYRTFIYIVFKYLVITSFREATFILIVQKTAEVLQLHGLHTATSASISDEIWNLRLKSSLHIASSSSPFLGR